MKDKLPAMWNAFVFAFILLTFSALVLGCQVAFQLDFGEPEWMFINTVAIAFAAGVTRTVKHYTNGNDD